jgi:hypothetical protein
VPFIRALNGGRHLGYNRFNLKTTKRLLFTLIITF